MKTFYFLTIAGPAIGFGHLSRCINLAKAFEAADYETSFAVFGLANGKEIDALRSRPVVYGELEEIYTFWLGFNATPDRNPDCVIVDVAHTSVMKDLDRCEEMLARLRSRIRCFCVIDGVGEQSIVSWCPNIAWDAVIRPYVSAGDEQNRRGNLLAGAGYAILAPEYSNSETRMTRRDANRVFVSCGGSDPLALTRTVIQALLNVKENLDVRVIIGPLFKASYEDELRKMVEGSGKRFGFIRHPSSLAEDMRWSDVAIVTSGLVKYELAATGTPAITLSIDEYHNAVNRVFSAAGSVIDLGLDHSVGSISDAVVSLLGDEARRARMSVAGKSFVDGFGATRVVNRLVQITETINSVHTN